MDSSVTTRDLFRYTWHYWRQNTKYLYLTIAGILICVVLNNVIVPLYVRHITDMVANTKLPVDQSAYTKIWSYFFVFAAASFGNGIVWAFALFCWNYFSSLNLYRASGDALYKVQRFSADWHANTFAGGTVRKITRGTGAFDVFCDRIILGFLVVFTVMIASVLTLATRLPPVAIFVAIIVTLYFLSSLYFTRKYLRPLFQRVAQSDTALGSTLADIMTGIPTIKAFATEDREDDLFHGVRLEWRNRALKAWQVARVIDTTRTLIRLLMLSGMLGITIYLWAHGKATPGDVALVLTCFFMTQNMLRDMGTFVSDIQKAASEMEDIVYFWKYEDDVRDRPGAGALTTSTGGGAIAFKNVTFQYKNTKQPVYENLSIDVRAGERVALVGPSGSGKSTFVKLVQRLYDIQGGVITIDGQNIANVTQQSLRSKVALVPQDPILFHRSLAENIAYGRPDATREQIESAAKQAYAHRFIMHFPQGYDTLVGERGVKLSGGERQRVAIARAILTDAPILVMDEATSSLDSLSEHYIQQALENLMRGRTVITIAHRLATIRTVDRILVFDNGRIAEQGAHNELLENPNSLYKKLYDMQALGLIDVG